MVAVVIGRAENPRCFRGLNKSHLPVRYYTQKKAWMSAEILDKVLTTINRKLSSTNCFIWLFMDNAGCHPEEFNNRYGNVKIVFLPPNPTSKLQPLDLGTIQNLRTHYCSLLLKYMYVLINVIVHQKLFGQLISSLPSDGLLVHGRVLALKQYPSAFEKLVS